MYRVLKYLTVIVLLVAAAVWLADNPGSVSLDWGGYRVDAPFSVILIAIILLVVFSAIIYRFWLFLRRSPGMIGESRRENRRRRGYLALTRGMVAVAAGDVKEAEKNAREADNLLSDPPLTMLLSAQAAQLAGDENAAEKYFDAMAEKPEMAFLGLKGRLTQALKAGDEKAALGYARKAHTMRPKTDWANDALFDLLVKDGQWAEADTLVRGAVKNKLLKQSDGNRRLAILMLQQARHYDETGNGRLALKMARSAVTTAPDLVPASRLLADIWATMNKPAKAESTLEEIWSRSPQGPLVSQYMGIRPAADVMAAIPKVERLAGFNSSHPESALALAEASLKASLWGEARKHLKDLIKVEPSALVCRLMAELEEAENQNLTEARDWLRKASVADPDPAWVCASCGHVVGDWDPLCPKCRSFDSLQWRVPPAIHHMEDAVAGLIKGPMDGAKPDIVTVIEPAKNKGAEKSVEQAARGVDAAAPSE
jgi:HemY protein